MAPPQQISRSGFSSIVYPVFCGGGEWATTPPSDLQDVEEDTYYPHHSLHL